MSDQEGVSHEVQIETAPAADRLESQGLRPGSIWYRLVQYTMRFLLWAWRLRMYGRHHLPSRGPFLICSNHPSELDPVALGAALPFRPSFLAGHELERYPVIFWLLNRFDPVLVRRGATDIGALRACLRRLRAGDVMVIYPEGGVVQDRPLGELQSGAAFLAIRTRVPIVPAAITGIAEVWPLGARFPARWPWTRRITIRLGPPLHPKPGERPDELTRRLEEAILELLSDGARAGRNQALKGSGDHATAGRHLSRLIP